VIGLIARGVALALFRSVVVHKGTSEGAVVTVSGVITLLVVLGLEINLHLPPPLPLDIESNDSFRTTGSGGKKNDEAAKQAAIPPGARFAVVI